MAFVKLMKLINATSMTFHCIQSITVQVMKWITNMSKFDERQKFVVGKIIAIIFNNYFKNVFDKLFSTK